jgi:inosose dehydratase
MDSKNNLKDSLPGQLYKIGYQLVHFHLSGQLDEGFPLLNEAGYKWYEGFVLHSLGHPISRREETYGNRAPFYMNDVDFIRQLANYGRAPESYGVRTIALFVCTTLTNPNLWSYERDILQVLAHFLKGCDAPYLTLTGGPPSTGGNDELFPHTEEAYYNFTKRLEEIGSYTKNLGVKTLFHPQIDCFVETIEQLDRYMEIVDTDLVGLCFDTAHIFAMGGNPVETLKRYQDKIDYVHLKDCKDEARTLKGYARHMAMCDLGDGSIDLPLFIKTLNSIGFKGWLTLEVDARDKSPKESFLANTQYAKEVLGLKLNP